MLANDLLSWIRAYTGEPNFRDAFHITEEPDVSFLAQGEYNLNYLLRADGRRFVLRVNTGSQMHLDNQIAYEYSALRLLSPSGVTPRPLYLDDSRRAVPYGLLVMEYLLGEPLDYKTDLILAARSLAKIHSLEFSKEETAFLVREPGPLRGIYKEVENLLSVYTACPRSDPEAASLLEAAFVRAGDLLAREALFLSDPWLRVVNTELNSHNFMVNRADGTCHVIDWEKPIYGEPAQDLAHFIVATTTLWKRDYILSQEEEKLFLDTYLGEISPCPQSGTLTERIEILKFFTYLRAVSWCAMAWTEYTTPGRPLQNQDTFRKIRRYMEPDFLKRYLSKSK